jgi:homeobox protein cut-like
MATLLRDELRAKEEGLAMERRASSVKILGLERQAADLASKIAALESQLALAPNPEVVEGMKRELRVLKRLEYNAVAEDDASGADEEHNPEIAGVNEDLESVLVAKLRRVESDLVTERTARAELRGEIEALQRSMAEADAAKADLEKLVSSLEADLERAIAASSATVAAPSAKSTRSGSSRMLDIVPTDGAPAMLQQVLDPDNADASPPSEPAARSTPSPALSHSASITAQERADDDHSVATIVMAQRDRLRARCEALEAERDSFKHELQVQVQASESLKSDNTKLYEKVRYLQSFAKPGGGGSVGGLGQQHRGSGVAYHRGSLADRDLDLEALEQRYEASVDPFRQFSRAERQRKLNEMSPMERTVFIVAKTFLGKCVAAHGCALSGFRSMSMSSQ